MKIGEKLRAIRTERGLSLREASRQSGVSHSYIDSIEKGMHPKTKSPIHPSPETLRQLSKAYHYSYEELMESAGYLDDKSRKRIINDQTKNAAWEKYTRLPPEKKKLVDEVISGLFDNRSN